MRETGSDAAVKGGRDAGGKEGQREMDEGRVRMREREGECGVGVCVSLGESVWDIVVSRRFGFSHMDHCGVNGALLLCGAAENACKPCVNTGRPLDSRLYSRLSLAWNLYRVWGRTQV